MSNIERILLPAGEHFSLEQMKAITAGGNINIVAGPGSGKTTILAAKLISLLAKQKRGDKGICCITHTNIAVKEIKDRVELCGLPNIEYPNFIGTIQSFFDHYFARKAFGILLPETKMRILDGDQYFEIYSQKFLSYFPNWSYSAPSYKKRNAHLVIDKNHAIMFKNDEKKYYASGINSVLKWILDHGIINSEQMTTLAHWYISCHTDKLKAAIGERFDFLLLDEAQDTSSEQYRLLMQLTEGTNVQFQRFGDPYQALYTIYGNETVDAWNPIIEAEKGVAQVKEISTTVRFGPHIANLVKDVCYENYSTFHPSKSSSSLENCLIIFEDEEDLRRKYQRLIQRCVTENTDFSECHKKDEIVAPLHEDLKRWFPNYDKSLNVSHNPKYKDVFNAVQNELAHLNRMTKAEEHELLQQNLDLASLVGKIIKGLVTGNMTREELERLIIPFIPSHSRKEAAELSDTLLAKFMYVSDEITGTLNKTEQQINLSTIHGVKGETHRSTFLLLDSEVYWSKKDHENFFFKTLYPFLIGKRRDYGNELGSKSIKDCLKYAYVALSRPKFLAGVAIPTSSITTSQKRKMLDYGWEEVK